MAIATGSNGWKSGLLCAVAATGLLLGGCSDRDRALSEKLAAADAAARRAEAAAERAEAAARRASSAQGSGEMADAEPDMQDPDADAANASHPDSDPDHG